MFQKRIRSASIVPRTNGLQSHVQDYLSALGLRRYSPKTLAVYGNGLESFLGFAGVRGRERMPDLTREDLEAWRLSLLARRLAPASLEVYLRAVRQFFAWLEDRQVVFLNPAQDLVIPRSPRTFQPVQTQAQMRALLAQPNTQTLCGLRDRALIETGYSTGARREELSRLDVRDLDLGEGTLRVLGKGEKERVLPLGRQAVHWLSRYLREARPELLRGDDKATALWIDLHGHAMDYSALQQILRRHCIAAGIQPIITPHAIRRACATHMLQNDAHPLQLQALLGHATTSTLGHYLRLTITELQSMHRRSKPGR